MLGYSLILIMKNLFKPIFGLAIIFSFLGCNDYLDIVPDRTQEVSLMFERKEWPTQRL